MNTRVLDALTDFAIGLGFDTLPSLGDELGLQIACGQSDIIGFRPVKETLLCFLKRRCTAFELDQAWYTLFQWVKQPDMFESWHIGLEKENNLVVFTYLPQIGVDAVVLYQIFDQIWQMREWLPQGVD